MGALCAGEIVKESGSGPEQWAVTSYLRQGKPSEGGPNDVAVANRETTRLIQ